MAAKFDWQTEEEPQDVWEAPEPARPARRRRWLIPLLLALLMAAVLYAGFRQAQQRVSEAEAQAAEEVRASQRLARRAASNADQELFVTVLSGRDHDWTDMQTRLLTENLQFEQAGRALGLEPQPEEAEVEAVRFTPDMAEAEVVTVHSYTVDDGEQSLQLKQSRIYRRGNDRWLFSPPNPEYWGKWRSWQGRYVLLHYPDRDAALAEQLAGELDEMLGELCVDSFGLACPDDFVVRVRLEKSPDSLLIAGEPLGARLVAGEIDLPTFSLLGLPAGDEAREALFKAYARQLIPTVVAELVQYHCCEHILFFQAAAAWQMQALGAGQWPLAEREYGQIVDNAGNEWQTLQRLWPVSAVPEDGWTTPWYAYSLLEFLLAGAGTGAGPVVARLQRNLNKAPDLFTWVQIGHDYQTVDALMSRWRDHLIERIMAEERTVSLPEQDLLLGRCMENGAYQQVRYDLQSGSWLRNVPQVAQRPAADVAEEAPVPSPGGRSALYQEGRHIVRRAEDGTARVVASGLRPFWLTEELYGFISDKHLLLADVRDDNPQRVLSLHRVFQVISGDVLQRFIITGILPVPKGNGSLVMVVDSPYENRNYIVLLRPSATADLLQSLSRPEIDVLFQTRGKVAAAGSARFSQDGRWLSVVTANGANGGFYLYDMDAQQIEIDAAASTSPSTGVAISAQSWSDDGQWLAWLTAEHVELIALGPKQGYARHFLPLPEELILDPNGCPALAWIGPGDGS